MRECANPTGRLRWLSPWKRIGAQETTAARQASLGRGLTMSGARNTSDRLIRIERSVLASRKRDSESNSPPGCLGGADLRPVLLSARDVVPARVPDHRMTPFGEPAPFDAWRGRRRSGGEARVQRGSDRGSAFLEGTLSRRCNLDRGTPYTPRRVPQLGNCGRRKRQQASRHR